MTEYAGPTALARALLADAATDDAIMAAYAAHPTFGPSSTTPLKFTRTDLRRLRARVTGVTVAPAGLRGPRRRKAPPPPVDDAVDSLPIPFPAPAVQDAPRPTPSAQPAWVALACPKCGNRDEGRPGWPCSAGCGTPMVAAAPVPAPAAVVAPATPRRKRRPVPAPAAVVDVADSTTIADSVIPDLPAPPAQHTPPTALGIYIFAGGFTLGVKRAGFDVRAQCEDGPYGVATTRANHPGLAVHTDPPTWPFAEHRDRVDFVYGNPPCAPFSNAGISSKKVGTFHDWWKRDPRTSCITKMFAALEVVRPRVWAWESVQRAFKAGRELVDSLTAEALALGYSASYVLLNAAHLGVPQIRRRFFCVFHDIAIPWEYPRVAQPMTVNDAWRDIIDGRIVDASPEPPTPTNNPEHMTLLRGLAPGGSLRAAWERANPPATRKLNKLGGVIGRPRFLDVRLDGDAPSPTLTGGATKFHPQYDRYITLLEQQLLCGYPPDYAFVGPTLANKYAQTAQAVMPPIGEWLARNVRAALDANVPYRGHVAIVDLEQGRTEVIR